MLVFNVWFKNVNSYWTRYFLGNFTCTHDSFEFIGAHGTDLRVRVWLLSAETLLQAKNFTGYRWDPNPGSCRKHGRCCKRAKPLPHLNFWCFFFTFAVIFCSLLTPNNWFTHSWMLHKFNPALSFSSAFVIHMYSESRIYLQSHERCYSFHVQLLKMLRMYSNKL